MSALKNLWQQLLQRRLLPVAILLVAALAAVPLALAKDPEPVPPAPEVAQTEEAGDLTKTIVTPAVDDGGRDKAIGKSKNPFAMPPKDEAADEPATDGPATDGPPKTPSTDSPGSTGGATDTPSTAPTAPGVAPTAPTAPAKPKKTYDRYDLTVRFGDSTASPDRMTLKRLQPLPKADLPALLYLGVSKDGKSAIFLVEEGVQVVGDGVCAPTPEDCETLRLEAGETEFLDVIDETGNATAQYQLDLVKIHKGKTASSAKASASSKAGRKILAERASTAGRLPFRFDVDSGTLERRPGAVGDVARTTASIG
jgi:hypothetical protein